MRFTRVTSTAISRVLAVVGNGERPREDTEVDKQVSAAALRHECVSIRKNANILSFYCLSGPWGLWMEEKPAYICKWE